MIKSFVATILFLPSIGIAFYEITLPELSHNIIPPLVCGIFLFIACILLITDKDSPFNGKSSTAQHDNNKIKQEINTGN